MKAKLLTSLVIICLMVALSAAQAQDVTDERSFGIGAQITSPAGLSMQGWISDNAAIASVVSFNLRENASSFYIHADYQMHKRYNTPNWDIGFLSYYYGVGGRYIWQDIGIDNNFFGIRLPGGLNFTFTDIPFDFYIEMAPVLDVAPEFGFGFTGGIGFRYFLN